MKKLHKTICVIMCVILAFCLFSCERSKYAMEQDAKYESAYSDGYSVGYDEGYSEGISDAQEHLENRIQDISWDVKEAHGISPEKALQILTNYADGEPITEAQLHQAIWAINEYCWDSYEDINDIDSYY